MAIISIFTVAMLKRANIAPARNTHENPLWILVLKKQEEAMSQWQNRDINRLGNIYGNFGILYL